jgi:hypothetical protein
MKQVDESLLWLSAVRYQLHWRPHSIGPFITLLIGAWDGISPSTKESIMVEMDAIHAVDHLRRLEARRLVPNSLTNSDAAYFRLPLGSDEALEHIDRFYDHLKLIRE